MHLNALAAQTREDLGIGRATTDDFRQNRSHRSHR
jgi:hypothetical protein